MLSNVLRYSEVYAKIRAMRSVLLSNEEYKSIANLKTVKEIGRALKESPDYKHVMDDLSESDLKREPLEKKLFLMFFSDFSRLYSYVPSAKERRYLTDYFHKFEIIILKALMRIVMDERDHTYDLTDYAEIKVKHLTINVKKLATSKTIDELIKNLEGTSYYKVFMDVKKNYDNPTLFQMESQLDLTYYLNIWKSQKRNLQGETMLGEKEINGTDVDIQNILTIYRVKKYYPTDDTLIFSYLIPIHYRLRQADIEKMAGAKDEGEFFQYLSESYYGRFFSKFLQFDISRGSEGVVARDFERCYYAALRRANRKMERKNPYSISTVTSYLNSRYQEIRNLTTIIEGVRYERMPEDILKRIIYVKGRERGATT